MEEQHKHKYGDQDLKYASFKQRRGEDDKGLWFFDFQQISLGNFFQAPQRTKLLAEQGIARSRLSNYALHEEGEKFFIVGTLIHKNTIIMNKWRFKKTLLAIRYLNPNFNRNAIIGIGKFMLQNYKLCPFSYLHKDESYWKEKTIADALKEDFSPSYHMKAFQWDYTTLWKLFEARVSRADRIVGDSPIKGDKYLRKAIDKVVCEDQGSPIKLVRPEEWMPLPPFYGEDTATLTRSCMQRSMGQSRVVNHEVEIIDMMETIHESLVKITQKLIAEGMGVDLRTVERHWNADLSQSMNDMNSLRIHTLTILIMEEYQSIFNKRPSQAHTIREFQRKYPPCPKEEVKRIYKGIIKEKN